MPSFVAQSAPSLPSLLYHPPIRENFERKEERRGRRREGGEGGKGGEGEKGRRGEERNKDTFGANVGNLCYRRVVVFGREKHNDY